MEKLIDLKAYPIQEVLPLLLKDKTTKKNIIWATDTYKDYGSRRSDPSKDCKDIEGPGS